MIHTYNKNINKLNTIPFFAVYTVNVADSNMRCVGTCEVYTYMYEIIDCRCIRDNSIDRIRYMYKMYMYKILFVLTSSVR